MNPDPNAFYDGGLAVETYDVFAGQTGKMVGDVAFYLDHAKAQGGPVLELGTGTGRVLLPLIEAGLETVGVDVSRPMLDVAERSLALLPAEVRVRAELICAPMQAFETARTFDLALIPARAFQHLTDPRDQRATLERVRERLNPGGLLILDLFDPRLEVCVGRPPLLPTREALDPQTGRRFRKTCLERLTDPFAQTTSEHMRVEELNAVGEVVGSQETSWTMRWSTRQESAYLLELSGFAPVAEYSDFARSPPAYGREQIWVAGRN